MMSTLLQKRNLVSLRWGVSFLNKYCYGSKPNLSPNDESKCKQNNVIRLKKDDPTLSKFMLKVKSAKLRKRHNMVLLEGKRLIADALVSGLSPLAIFVSSISDLDNLDFDSGKTQVYKMPFNELKLWSGLTTPPGIFAFMKIVDTPVVIKTQDVTIPLTIICDEIRDPGNLGSIIRSSAGVGAKNLILTKGCADPWDAKVLRSGCGGHFRIPISTDISWEDMGSMVKPGCRIFLADSNLDERSEIAEYSQPETDSMLQKLELLPYYNCNPSLSENALVLGGEASGISRDAMLFASSMLNSTRVHVPLANQLESLNTSAAASIIMFEIRRQCLHPTS